MHLYSLQVLKDLVAFDPSSLAAMPFRGNGSQRPLERGFHLIRDGKDHDFVRACSPEQRVFIAEFLEYLVDQYSAELDEYTYSNDMLKAYDIWSVG